MHNYRRLLKSLAVLGILLVQLGSLLFVPGLFFLPVVNFATKDWYTGIPCGYSFRVAPGYTGGVKVYSGLCIETGTGYGQIADWYEQRSWWCDGTCVYTDWLDMGVLQVSTYKSLSTRHTCSLTTSCQLFLYESYVIDWPRQRNSRWGGRSVEP